MIFHVADLSPVHFNKATGTYGPKNKFPGFGFDSGPNIQPCENDNLHTKGVSFFQVSIFARGKRWSDVSLILVDFS